MKKTTCLAALLSAPLVFTAPAAHSELSGIYVGGGLGAFGSYDVKGAVPDPRPDWSSTTNYGFSDWLSDANIFVGYGERVGDFYVGGEFALLFDLLGSQDVEEKRDVVRFETEGGPVFTRRAINRSIEAGDGYSISGRLGYLFTPQSMFYVKLSHQVREFKLRQSEQFQDIPMINATFSGDEDFTGFGLGIGAEHQFSEYPLAVRLEAMRIDYSSEDSRLRFRQPDGSFEDVDIGLDPVESTAKLQLAYRF